MKLRRKKLVALAMSALMVASVMPVASFAEDESAVYFEEVADETPVGEDSEYFITEEEYDDVVAEADDFVVDETEDYDIAADETYDYDFVAEAEEDLVGDSKLIVDETTVTYNKTTGKFDYIQYAEDDTAKEKPVKGSVEGKKIDAKSVAPTCDKDGFDVYLVEIGTTYAEEITVTVEKLGGEHEWEEVANSRKWADSTPKCADNASSTYSRKCKKCGTVENDVEDTETRAAHTWGEQKEEIVESSVSESNNTKYDTDGKTVVLIKDSKDGKYYIVRYKECAVCGEKTYYDENGEESESEVQIEVKIPAKYREDVYAEVIDVKGLANESDLLGKTSKDEEPVIDDEGNLLNASELVLADCSKAGSYKVEFKDKDGDTVAFSDGYITIPAHHIYGEVSYEFKNASDAKQVTPIYDEKDTTKIVGFKNLNCKDSITYYEVYHCVAESKGGKCNLKDCKATNVPGHSDTTGSKIDPAKKVTKTLAPSDIHTYQEVKEEVEALVAEAKKANKRVDLEDLEDLLLDDEGKQAHKYVKLVGNNICDEGTVTVEYTCILCGKKISTSIETAKRDHVPGDPVKDPSSVKEATCTEAGSYDTVVKCTRCGKVLSETTHVVKKKAHTNAKDADKVTDAVKNAILIKLDGGIVIGEGLGLEEKQQKANKVGIDGYAAEAYAYTLCGTCGGNKVKIDSEDVTITIDALNKSVHDCVAGSITLTASYTKPNKEVVSTTKTFPYYETRLQYAGRMAHVPGTPEADGTVKCKICGTILEEGSGEPAHTHKEGTATRENYVKETCGVEGSYDLVTKCEECGEVIDTVHITVPALKHNFSAWSMYQKRSVFQIGRYERTCSICGKRQTKSMPKYTSVCALNRQTITIKVGQKVSVRVTKHHPGDTIGSVSSTNNAIAKGFKADSYIAKIVGKGVGTATFTVKMKAGATASVKVIVKKK